MNKLSVAIITLNEERDLPRCLESVRDIANEIVVIDSGSKDDTVEIARNYGAIVYTRKFDNYANQKNYAADKATGKWILSLDADEVIEPQLAKEIVKRTSEKGLEINAYTIPRKNIIFGKLIRYSRWQPELDRHIWLWRKDKGKWLGDIHEEVVVKDGIGDLVNAKIHYQYETVREFMIMMNNYSELDAKRRTKDGIYSSYFKLFFDPIYNFLVRYFYRLGFLDGWRGFFLSYLMAVYHLELWIKVWESKNV